MHLNSLERRNIWNLIKISIRCFTFHVLVVYSCYKAAIFPEIDKIKTKICCGFSLTCESFIKRRRWTDVIIND